MADESTETQVASGKDDVEFYKKELEKVRKEAAERRVKVREYEEAEEKRQADLKLKEEEDAKKRGEFEKLDAERKAELESMKRSIAQKEAAMRKRLVDEALRARLADAVDPDVVKLIDRDGITVDADTLEITGIDDVVKSFREAKPHFFGASTTTTATGTNANGRGPTTVGTKSTTIDFNDTSVPLDQLIAQHKATRA